MYFTKLLLVLTLFLRRAASYPFLVAVVKHTDTLNRAISGALITESWILTSAYFRDPEEDFYSGKYIAFANLDNFKKNLSFPSRWINTWISRPDYEGLSNVALLKTEYPFRITQGVQPVLLAPVHQETSQGCTLLAMNPDFSVLHETLQNASKTDCGLQSRGQTCGVYFGQMPSEGLVICNEVLYGLYHVINTKRNETYFVVSNFDSNMNIMQGLVPELQMKASRSNPIFDNASVIFVNIYFIYVKCADL